MKNHLLRIGNLEDEIICFLLWEWKNHGAIVIRHSFLLEWIKMEILWPDFMQGRTHDIIECEDCLLGVEENKDILDIIKGL